MSDPGSGPLGALPECRACYTPIGGYHETACTVARCLQDGSQRVACHQVHAPQLGDPVTGHGRHMWTGYMPGTAEAAELGWNPASGDAPDGGRATWDRVARRWRLAPVGAVDDTGYVQWHLDRGVPVPPGEYRVNRDGVLVPGDYRQRAAAAGRIPGSAGYPLSEPGDPAVLTVTLSRGECTVTLTGYAPVSSIERPGFGGADCWIGRNGWSSSDLLLPGSPYW